MAQYNTDAFEDDCRALKALYLTFHGSDRFIPGTIVVWKDGLKNKNSPAYNQAAIVVDHLDSPIVSDQSPTGSPYFQERLDLKLGLIDSDGDYVVYTFDSRRFETA